MPPGNYLQELEARLRADGCEIARETTPTTSLLIGQRSDFRIQWAATKLHLFTIAAIVPEVTVPILEQFTDFAMTTAVERKKGLPRGLQTGVAVFPALISENVDQAAFQRASHWQKIKFACMARPTVVDTSARAVGAHRGTPIAGLLYAPYLRKKNEQYFPQPQ